MTTEISNILDKLTTDDRADVLRQYYASENLYHFNRDVLGLTILQKSNKKWERILFNNIDIATLQDNEEQTFILFEAPRETYKSTFWTIGFVIYALTINPNLAIAIVSSVYDNACKWLNTIKKLITSPTFKLLYGDWYNRSEWRDGDIVIANRDTVRSESSITCLGLNSTVTSKHFDIMVIDDLVNPEDRDSPAKREKSIKFIDDIIDLLNKKSGFALFLGTPWHHYDAYSHIEKIINPRLVQENVKPYFIYKEPAINSKGEPNFPDILPLSKLKEIRLKKSDISNYSANYLLNPLHPSTQIFKQENFSTFNYHEDFPDNISSIAIHLDPSQEDKKGSDFSAFVAVGIRKSDNRRLILDCWIDKMRPSKREEVVFTIYQYYKQFINIEDVTYQIETVAGQKEIKRSMINFMVKEKNIADFQLRSKEKVANKVSKITTLELPISNGTLLFREDWTTAPNNYRLLIDQLCEFPLGHDDGPDALKEAFDLTHNLSSLKFGVV